MHSREGREVALPACSREVAFPAVQCISQVKVTIDPFDRLLFAEHGHVQRLHESHASGIASLGPSK